MVPAAMKFLIVDDHPILRDGLTALLRQVFAASTVVEAADAAAAFGTLAHHDDIDLVLLDLNLAGLAGLDAIGEFGRRRADLPVIVLSSSEDGRDVRRAIGLGARGYVPKSATRTALVAAIRFVLDGGVYVPPFVLTTPGEGEAGTRPAHDGVARLTSRQVEILVLVSQGEPNKGIARRLDLAEKTVKVHVTAIFKALQVVNRTQAAIVARAAGLV